MIGVVCGAGFGFVGGIVGTEKRRKFVFCLHDSCLPTYSKQTKGAKSE